MTLSAPKLKHLFKKNWTNIKNILNQKVLQRWVNRFFKDKSLIFIGWGRVNKGGLLKKTPKIQTFWLDLKTDQVLLRNSVLSSVVGWVLGCRSDNGEVSLPAISEANLTFPSEEPVIEDLSGADMGLVQEFTSLLEKEGEPDFFCKVIRLSQCLAWVPARYQQIDMPQQKALFVYKEGQVYILPLFELARVLFLSKAYLAREAFNPTVLPDFCVHSRQTVEQDGVAACEVECSKSVPKALFSSEEKGLLEKIIQILLVPTLKRSYGSIFIKMVEEENDGFFDFELPNLSEVELDLSVENVVPNVFFVTEVLGVRNLPSFVGEVNVHFPFSKKKEDKPVTTSGGKVNGTDTDSDTGADDSGESNPGMSKNIGHVRLRKVITSYRHKTSLNKFSQEKEKSVRKQRMLNPEFESGELIGGFTQEEWGGKLAQMEFDSIECPTEDDFVQKIKAIAEKNDLDCQYEVYKVPSSGSGRYYIVNAATNERRKAMCFSFKAKGQQHYDRFLIELERREKESISTLIIYASPQDRKAFFKELLALCDLRHGHWSDEIFSFLKSKRTNYRIVGHRKVKHKKVKTDSSATKEDVEKKWFATLESKIVTIHKNN